MADQHNRPDWEPDTDRLPAVNPSVAVIDGYPTANTDGGISNAELIEELLDGPDGPAPAVPPPSTFRRRLGKAMMAVGGTMIALVVAYLADVMFSMGDVPRGVTVAGVTVGGMTPDEAEATLRTELEPRFAQPVAIKAGDVDTSLAPAGAGLRLDWTTTLEHAGRQPLNPWTRITSFFTSRDVHLVADVDKQTLAQAVARLAQTKINRTAVEGRIDFQPAAGGKVTPIAVVPKAGQKLNQLEQAVAAVEAGWLRPGGVEIPIDTLPVKATPAGVQSTLDTIVKPAIAGPVILRGEKRNAVVRPNLLAAAFQFSPTPEGVLDVRLDQARLERELKPQLESTERAGKDAHIIFAGGAPQVVPAEDGRKVNWAETFKGLTAAMTKPVGRETPVAYQIQPPAVTTEAANALGIKEVIAEFSTRNLAASAATNVRAMAGQVAGAIVRPGETFSLDERTGPRTASGGYVAAPMGEDGTGPSVIGGGVSQLTSTLYNAAYLAGMKDAGHAERDYYLARYPAARDAKSIHTDGSNVDMRFTNDGPTAVAIQASVSGGMVTVKLWGTKQVRVESSTGPRTNTVDAPIEFVPAENCQPSAGVDGFAISDTRVVSRLSDGAEVSRETRITTYQPKPEIVCW